MSEAIETARLIRSGPFRLDRRERRLTRAGKPVPLTGLPFRILELLMLADGAMVTRAELKRILWPHAQRIDTERRLNTAVRALREALGETADEPRHIATIRGHGYRWIVPPEAERRKAPPWWPKLAAAGLACLIVGGDFRATPVDGPVAGPGDAVQPWQVRRAEAALAQWREQPGRSTLAGARAALVRARVAAPRDPRTSVLAAELALGADWDWQRAETLYRDALSRDPADASAHRGLAWLYVNLGSPDRAWPHVARLLAGGPLDAADRADTGWLMIRSGRPDLALALCAADGTAQLNLLSCRHTALAGLGLVGEARAVALQVQRILAAHPAELAAVESAAPAAGYARYLDWRVDRFAPSGPWFQRAQLEAEAGRYQQALDSLDRAVAVRDPMLVKIGSTEAFRTLASSPRFRSVASAVLGRS